jgi:hypothetical protein
MVLVTEKQNLVQEKRRNKLTFPASGAPRALIKIFRANCAENQL